MIISGAPVAGNSSISTPIRDYVFGSGNDTVPSGAINLLIEVRSAGGSGRQDATTHGCGGGGGAYGSASIPITSADWGTTCPYVCGAPGAAKSSVSNGSAGVTSSFGPVTLNSTSHAITCTGGAGGSSLNGLGGTSTGGTTNTSGGNASGTGFSSVGGSGANAGGAGGFYGSGGSPTGGGGGAGDLADSTYSGAGAQPRIRFTYT